MKQWDEIVPVNKKFEWKRGVASHPTPPNLGGGGCGKHEVQGAEASQPYFCLFLVGGKLKNTACKTSLSNTAFNLPGLYPDKV